jgi:hypothetical protein
MSDLPTFDPDMANAIERGFIVAREARAVFGTGRQDLKAVEECFEYGEAASKLAAQTAKLGRSLTQRLAHDPRHERGAIEEEAADVQLTLLGMFPAESSFWDFLRGKTARLESLIEEAKR